MNQQQTVERLYHPFRETSVISAIQEGEKYFDVSTDSSTGFMIEKPVQKVPQVGQVVTLYLFQGSRIQGIDLDDEMLFFKTKDDLEVERQAAIVKIEREKKIRKRKFDKEFRNPGSAFNVRLSRLPKVFQQRFRKFFRLGEDFWDVAWYELVACEAAVHIAYACGGWQHIQKFRDLSWEEQNTKIPTLEQGLSGNQIGFACAVATLYLRNPKLVPKIRGAMSPLTGSKTYIGK